MAAPNLIPNLMTGNTQGANQSMAAIGTIPVGNNTGSTMPGPTGMAALTQGAVAPVGSAIPTGTPGASAVPAAPVNGLTPGGPGVVNSAGTDALDKQLNDVYGKGVGGEIGSAISNLGSGDSSYLQAYQTAMGQTNATSLTNLDTQLSNEGISASSSVKSIADASLVSQQDAQVGLQEQQLQQSDKQDLLGLLTGTEGAANKEASTSVWGDIGSVLGAVSGPVSGVLGLL